MLINYASRIAHCLAAASIYKSITRNLKFIPTSPLCLYAIRYLDIPPVQPLPPPPPPSPLSPLYSRRQRTAPSPRSFLSPQSFHPISLNPPHLLPLRLSLSLSLSLPSVSHHRHAKPPSTRPVTYPRTPPTKRRTAVMAAVTESIKVVLMRLNCRRYCRPAATLPPHSARILHPFFADADSTHLFRTFSIASTRLLCPSLSFSLEIDIPVPFP